MNIGYVAKINRRTVSIRADNHLLKIGHGLDVTEPPHHVFASRVFHHASTHVVITSSDGRNHLVEWKMVGKQRIGIDVHLILLHKSADTSHLRDAGHAFQPVAEIPVLKGPQLSQIMPACLVNQRVHVDPSHPGCIWTERGCDTFRQAALHALHNDAGPVPVEICLVIENDIDKGEPEE